jgi:hypothetical protein
VRCNCINKSLADSGAGTLIRRGTSIKRATSVSDFEDLEKLKETLFRHDDPNSKMTVHQYLEFLKENPFTAYYDDSMQCLAIVVSPGPHSPVANLSRLAIGQSGWLTNIPEDIFTAIKKDYDNLTWTISEDDDNLSWFFEKADGTYNHNGRVLFYRGVDGPNSEALVPIFKEFISQ